LIVKEVQAKFYQDPKLKLRDITVESHQGVVTLTGSVKTSTEKKTAELLASEVSGVASVVNSLSLPGLPPSEGTAHPQPPPPPPPGGNPQPGAGGEAGGMPPTWSNPIDQYLAKRPTPSRPSPLTGQGSVFDSNGQQYAIDPRLIVAISGAETSFATAKCHSTPVVETHNAWNWFWCYGSGTCGNDVCGNSPFDSWGSGIKTVSKFMRKNYINKGYDTVPLIRTKYCTAGCDYWVGNVTRFLEEMNGDPNNLTSGGSP
jgi:hypothetical protein